MNTYLVPELISEKNKEQVSELVAMLKEFKLSENEIMEIAGKFQIEKVKKHQVIVRMNESMDKLFLVIHGIARGVYFDSDGRWLQFP